MTLDPLGMKGSSDLGQASLSTLALANPWTSSSIPFFFLLATVTESTASLMSFPRLAKKAAGASGKVTLEPFGTNDSSDLGQASLSTLL